MRKLARITARLKDGSYNGAMIIKSVWKKEECINNCEPEILKENKRVLVCQARFDNENLTTTMLLNPRWEDKTDEDKAEVINENIWEIGKCWHIFQRQEVLDFVHDVGDTNPIHQLEVPIVPGIFLLEKIKDSLPRDIKYLELSYRNAVFAGDKLYFNIDTEQITVTGQKEFVSGRYR